MRPIDADEAHSKLTALYKNARKGEARRAYSMAIDIISDADTIDERITIPDVERVLNEATVFSTCFHERITLREFMNKVQKGECKKFRHGRWSESGHCECCGIDIASRLDKWTNVQSFNFCPNCGAKMDG